MSKAIILHSEHSLLFKIRHLNWILVIIVTTLAAIGVAALYSAAGGNFDPWASRQLTRFAIGFVLMIGIALVDIRWWFRLAWPAYLLGFVLLIVVEFMGRMGGGAERWIDLGFMQIQPSELMKIAVIMVLARYFHSAAPEDMKRILFLIPAILIMLAPVGMVLLQPNLGTALIIMINGAAMLFMAGAPVWMFLTGIGAVVAAVPVAWHFMHDYQRQRVMTFLNPESDPLGAGYHITQSKIAIGSGGINGKGFLNGSQSHLNFLPEKQTDFIFTLWVEEFGMVGGMFILALLAVLFAYGIWMAVRVKHNFGRYLCLALVINFSVYAFINIAMVMGLIPVVGIPLPLVSYGGTSMLAVMIGFGLMMSCSLYRDSKVTRV
jgi:rod shape determining protein RodA